MTQMLNAEIPKGLEVDHINRNRLDNRRENLRLATHSENQVNMDKKIGKSGFRGVRQMPGRTKWRAEITIGGKREFIGSYGTAKEAAIARDERAKKLFGGFAYLNFPLHPRP